jgi:hypothetical protein
MSACALVILAIVFGQPPTASSEASAIAAAKKAIVRQIDPSLPRATFETWLHGLVGARAVTKWEVNDCGEQTGNPALDQGRDFPMCAQVQVRLSGKRELYLSLAVGTRRKGVTPAPPVFFSGYLTEPGGPPKWIKSLNDLHAQVPQERATFQQSA